MQPVLAWLESTGLARTVGESLWITAWLSAFHVLGFTLVMSGGVVWNLRAAGLVLSDVAVHSIVGPANRLLTAGLAISLPTGLALFAPRASYTGPSGVFQLKMALLACATVYQLTVYGVLRRTPMASGLRLKAAGAAGLALWLALAGTACWFILFE